MAKIRNVALPSAYNDKLAVVLTLVPDAAIIDAGKRFLPGGVVRPQTVKERFGAVNKVQRGIVDVFEVLLADFGCLHEQGIPISPRYAA